MPPDAFRREILFFSGAANFSLARHRPMHIDSFFLASGYVGPMLNDAKRFSRIGVGCHRVPHFEGFWWNRRFKIHYISITAAKIVVIYNMSEQSLSYLH